jgi:hypothetical protein
MHQTQVTATEMHDHNIHGIVNPQIGESTPTAKTWEALAEIFETYGLTPQDLNIPWQSSRLPSPSTFSSAPGSRLMTPGGKVKPVTPLLPLEMLKSRSNSGKIDKGNLERNSSLKSNVSKKGNAQEPQSSKKGKDHDSKKPKQKQTSNSKSQIVLSSHEKVRIEGKFKSYTPSSWRDDLIQQKAQELSQVRVLRNPVFCISL